MIVMHDMMGCSSLDHQIQKSTAAPICLGNPPLESNNVFFYSRAQAENAGYRPCLRCRPELAPGQQIENDYGLLVPQENFTAWLDKKTPYPEQLTTGIQSTIGTPATQYRKTFQLGFAKTLLTDTALPISEISRISRFNNSREMLNALFSLYRRDPLLFRKPLPVQTYHELKSCALVLSYRPPFDWPALLNFFRRRAIAGIELVTDTTYQRSFLYKKSRGWLSVQNKPNINGVRLEIHATGLTNLMELVWRIKRMFDLDADPLTLQSCFENDTLLAPILNKSPGIRVPVAWDVYEYAIRAIVGQLISVQVATKLVTNIVEIFGKDLSLKAPDGIYKTFPTPEQLENANIGPCGLTKNKTTAIKNLTKAVLENNLELENNADLDLFIKQCTALWGIGEWTAQTIAMKGLGHKDAFPGTDLGIVKALTTSGDPPKPAQIRAMSESWQPLRAYAAMLLWSSSHK